MTFGDLGRSYRFGGGGLAQQSGVGDYFGQRAQGVTATFTPTYRRDMKEALREAKSLLYEAHKRAGEDRPEMAERIWAVFNEAEAAWLDACRQDELEAEAAAAVMDAEYGPAVEQR